MPLPKSIITTATLGTDQSILDTAPVGIRSIVHKGRIPSPQARLLATVAGLNLRDKAGWVPPIDRNPRPKGSYLDTRQRCHPQALRHLQIMLKGQFKALLVEWLWTVQQNNQRVPEEAVHLLLGAGSADSDLQDLIRLVIGKRGRWLSELGTNPDWTWLHPPNIDHRWQYGSDNERIEVIQFLRKTEPDRAREMVTATWSKENSKNRFHFLNAFSDGLSLGDEPFLDSTFDDGSSHLRKKARELLTKLPDSRFRQRMLAHAINLLELIDRNGMMMVELIPPDNIDTALERDDVVRKHSSPYEVAVNIIGHVSPRCWCEQWGLSIDDFIMAVANNPDWETKLFAALTLAAYNNHDTIFAEQLFPYAYPILSDQDRELLVATLSSQKIEMEAIHLLQTNPGGFHNGHLAMPLLFKFGNISRVRDTHLVSLHNKSSHVTWSIALTRAFLSSLQRYFAGEEVKVFGVSNTRTMLREVAMNIPISMRHDYLDVLSVEVRPRNEWRELRNEIRTLLDFRADMLAAIQTEA